MKISRKAFIRTGIFGCAALGLSKINTLNLSSKLHLPDINSPNSGATNEKYWESIRKYFCTSTQVINLNNAALSPQPINVQHDFFSNEELSNEAPSYFMWEKLNNKREELRYRLAEFIGANGEEIAICRNATEALNNIIFGINLQKGDEVVLSNLDYPFVINAWKQRALREGIKLKFVNLELPENKTSRIIKKYSEALTENTKVLHLTHMINWNGQIMPIKKLTKIAHQNNCKVLLDAAHSFAHLPHQIEDLKIDYYAASLHKWLCSPFGTGILQIKRDNIAEIWPLNSAYYPKSNDIRKFEFLGSRSYAAEMAVLSALEFHLNIGSELKYKRLSHLKSYWIDQVKQLEKFELLSPKSNKNEGGAIAAFRIEGLDAQDVANKLFKKYHIHTGIVNLPELKAIRISPHIYTLKKELDLLVKGIREIHELTL